MLRMTQIDNYLMMVVGTDAAGNTSCSGVWFSMRIHGIPLLVTIVMHSFIMRKRETSY